MQTESKERKIANKYHNRYLTEDMEEHEATKIAPMSLLQPFSNDLIQQIISKYKEVELSLRNTIGTPLYSDSGFILYCGNSCELLSRLESSNFSTNLTVTSPPYNIGKEYETPKALNEYVNWCSSWMTHIYHITKAHGSFWLNVGYLEVNDKGLCVPIPYLIWDKSPFYLLQEIVWKYGAGVTTKYRLSPRNEKWLFYIKNQSRYTFNLDEIRDPNVKYPNQKKNGKYRCNPFGKNPSDVWEFSKVTTGANRSSKERTDHPAQFPLQVVERIVRVSSNKLEIVLDPFAGSCSAGIAAVGLGRIFLGFEIIPEYCELAIKRYERFKRERDYAQKQLKLF
ncbi:MAG TPA: DNA-methyltransferase [Candidatus Wunengus sp. YC60]|uniref:DNA-methyltransferase n=1 Tax=Candidatus Wunengus sp. YC60 TaxID=3367697 RepID=UPI004029230C